MFSPAHVQADLTDFLDIHILNQFFKRQNESSTTSLSNTLWCLISTLAYTPLPSTYTLLWRMPKIRTLPLSPPCFLGLYTYFINRFRGIHFSDFSHSLIQVYDWLSRLQIRMNSRRKRRGKKTLHSKIQTEGNWEVLEIVPLFQTLTIIIAPATALASFKTATDTYLQKTSKIWWKVRFFQRKRMTALHFISLLKRGLSKWDWGQWK